MQKLYAKIKEQLLLLLHKNNKNLQKQEEVGDLTYLLYVHNKPETVSYEKQCVRICTFWWRRRESNSCPKTHPANLLRV